MGVWLKPRKALTCYTVNNSLYYHLLSLSKKIMIVPAPKSVDKAPVKGLVQGLHLHPIRNQADKNISAGFSGKISARLGLCATSKAKAGAHLELDSKARSLIADGGRPIVRDLPSGSLHARSHMAGGH
ncbi:hypothetical protein KM043_014730 [Ampulex compressa]|nr:hypothetical protein KM043_014730 [Ampulex compressa]